MKIVVAVDGSKYGGWATEWIGRLPLATPANVAAVHVVDLAALRAPFMVQPVVIGNEPFIKAETKRLEDQAKKVVAETTELLASLHLKGKAVSLRGSVAAMLLKRAPKGGMLVLGSRGLGALDRFMLGSVSTRVLHQAPCSVLIVKQPARPIRRILLATDGSKASERGLQFLLKQIRPRVPHPAGAEMPIQVAVIHVMPFLDYPEFNDTGKALVHYYADKLARAGYAVKEIQQLGNAADEILKASERHEADLIVTGAKGLGAVGRFLLGSVSTNIVQHSHCSVLVVR